MSTKITYNGKTTELADGYIATLPCKDLKMETDVVVEAPEGSGGGSSINVQPLTVTANGTFDAPEGQAYDPVTVDVKPITEPITITENGVYPVPKGEDGVVEIGKEYKFKKVITAEDFASFMSRAEEVTTGPGGSYTGLCYGDGNTMVQEMPISETASIYSINLAEYFGVGRSAVYFCNVAAAGGALPISNDGWYEQPSGDPTFIPIEPVSYTIPGEGNPDLETISAFFDVKGKSLDGWGEITVNVAPLPIEVSTKAEMTALLESGEVGGVYKYTGTTGTYENGALYVLEEEAAIGTFTHQYTGESTDTTTYEFEVGMTWAEWAGSDYDTNYLCAVRSNGLQWGGGGAEYPLYLNGVKVSADDLVISGATYTSQYVAGGGGSN